MGTIPTRNIINSLKRKGFEPDNRDHTFLFFYYKGKKTSVFTKISHGYDEYDKKLLSKVKRQLRLENREDLDQLIDCPITKEKYTEYLLKIGAIRP